VHSVSMKLSVYWVQIEFKSIFQKEEILLKMQLLLSASFKLTF